MEFRHWFLPAVLAACCLFYGCAAGTTAAKDDAAPNEHHYAALYSSAEAAMEQGETEKAIDFLKKAIEEDPVQQEAFRVLISIYEKEDASAHAEDLISAYETLYKMDAFSEADYLALGALYAGADRPGEMKQLLERGQVLNATQEKQALLDGLISRPSLESEDVQAMTAGVAASLAAEDFDAAADLLASDAWRSCMVSRLRDGRWRFHTPKEDAQNGMELWIETLQSGGDQSPASTVWALNQDQTLRMIHVDEGRITGATAFISNGAYDGAFTAESCFAETGNVYLDTGMMKNNRCTDAFSSKTALGTDPSDDLLALFHARKKLEGEEYFGTFDAEGHTAEKQSSSTKKKGIAYAYTKSKSKFLFIRDAEQLGAKDFSFQAEDFCIETFPNW